MSGSEATGVRGMGVRRRADPLFFLLISIVLAGIVFAGFGPSFYLRAWIDPPPMHADAYFTPMLYIHGTILTAWFGLLIVQSALINTGNIRLHRTLGLLGMGIAAALVVSVIPVMLDFAPRLVRAGLPVDAVLGFATMLIWFDVFNLLGFVVLVGWAYRRRRDGAFHKRLMIIASISLMPPAAFRALMELAPQLPGLPVALVIVAVLLASVALWDVARRKRVHPATMWASGIVILSYAAGFAVGATQPAQAFIAGLV